MVDISILKARRRDVSLADLVGSYLDRNTREAALADREARCEAVEDELRAIATELDQREAALAAREAALDAREAAATAPAPKRTRYYGSATGLPIAWPN